MEHKTWNISENATAQNIPPPCFLHACRYSVGEKVAFVLSFSIVFLVILLGNLLLCYLIFKERKLRVSSTWLSILNLAISDIIIAVFCMPILVIQVYTVESWPFGETICKAVPFFLNVGWISAIIILTIISIEKFMAVCLPFKCYWKSSFVKAGIFLAWFTAIVNALYYTIKADKKVITYNGKKYCIESERWLTAGENRHYLVTNIVLFYFVPLVTVLVLHMAIITKLESKTLRNLHEKIAGTQRRRNSKEAIKLLFVIALCFAVFTTPYEAYCIIVLVDPHLLDTNTDFHLFSVSLWLFFFNLSTHPFIYGLLSKKYKTALKREIFNLTFRSSETRLSVKFFQLDKAVVINNA